MQGLLALPIVRLQIESFLDCVQVNLVGGTWHSYECGHASVSSNTFVGTGLHATPCLGSTFMYVAEKFACVHLSVAVL